MDIRTSGGWDRPDVMYYVAFSDGLMSLVFGALSGDKMVSCSGTTICALCVQSLAQLFDRIL